MPSFLDEIGIIIYSRNDRFFIRETSENFWALLKILKLKDRLDKNWYARVEDGEIIEIDLNPNFDFKYD